MKQNALLYVVIQGTLLRKEKSRREFMFMCGFMCVYYMHWLKIENKVCLRQIVYNNKKITMSRK